MLALRRVSADVSVSDMIDADDLAPALHRVRAEQARILYETFAVGTFSSGFAALALAYGLVQAGRTDPLRAAVWSAMMAAAVAVHMALRAAYMRQRLTKRSPTYWLNGFTLIAWVEGIIWGLGAVWLTSPTDLAQNLMVAAVSVVMASGAVTVFQANLRTYLFYFFPTMLPYVGIFWFSDRPLHELLTALILTYIIVMPVIARYSNAQFIENLRLRFQNIDIARDLRQQKAVAEAANLAKSRFLAAASHDLRQPIHALGLLVGALRGRPLDAEAHRLVDHIDGSVTAMDDLFVGLLDISRLDAAAVRPEFHPIEIGPLLARLCQDHSGELAKKAIELRYVPCTAIVHSDPVLLERALRNLISNAVRYTEAGRVLVGCRRQGDRLRVEVWDTGCGIEEGQHERIFEEFYQIGNLERDRTKGLGLGLAIVRRMTVLIEAGLTFSSQVGVGSVFRLDVPLASDQRPVPMVPPPTPSSETEGLILVIDDEAAIQDAMTIALGGWGYDVIAAGTGDEMRVKIADEPRRPDLIICDYRLRAGENGITVIDRLRSEYNHDIPALLITGDTAPERISEAMQSGLPVMHKPLAADRLQLTVDQLLSGRLK